MENNMTVFIRKPSVNLYPGVKVTKDTVLEFQNEHVKQKVKNLTMHTVAEVSGEGYESMCDTTIHLQEGDVLLFESEDRGYIRPVEDFMTIREAIEELKAIEDLGG